VGIGVTRDSEDWDHGLGWALRRVTEDRLCIARGMVNANAAMAGRLF